MTEFSVFIPLQKNRPWSELKLDQGLFFDSAYPQIRFFSVFGSNRCMTLAGKVMYRVFP